MHIEQVSEHFFKLNNVLSETLLNTLQDLFTDRASWKQHNDASFNVREECNISIGSQLAMAIHKELDPVKIFAETKCNQLYPNAPQLWYDYPSYISNLHKDHSPNLSVNLQVYLSDSIDSSTGTHCCDSDVWYSVPYIRNCGYLLIRPTEIVHGMKTPVVDQRVSLYQSYRSTVAPVNIW